jgi:tryptophan 2,3-dioxygenase
MTYAEYLHLDQLLALQHPRSAPVEHDELLFIIAHQAYELWFKLLLHELDKAKRDLESNDLFAAITTFKRLRTIMKVAVEQVDVVETLTPVSFGSFRARLDTASGFQSAQFREIEFVLGYKRAELLKYQQPDTSAYAALVKRLNEPSVMDSLYTFLVCRGATLPPEVLSRDPARGTEANAAVEDELLKLYTSKEQPALQILFELMTDFDEGLQEWRYRHIQLVARTIGKKHGTGGSLGADFLKESLFRAVFPDLWAIRARL